MARPHLPQPLYLEPLQKEYWLDILARARANDISAAFQFISDFSPLRSEHPTQTSLQETLKDLQTPGIFWGSIRDLYTEEKQWAIEDLYLELKNGTHRTNFDVISDIIKVLGLDPLNPDSTSDQDYVAVMARFIIASKPVYHPWEWTYFDKTKVLEHFVKDLAENDPSPVGDKARKLFFELARPVSLKIF